MAYPEAVKAKALAALAANGGALRKTARELQIPEVTLRGWSKGDGLDVREKVREEKRDMAQALENLAWLLIQAAPKKLPDASMAQAITGAAIAIDKMRLLREQPPPTTEAEKTFAESMKAAAQAMVQMAQAAGTKLTIEEAEAKMRQIQLRESQELASHALQ